MIKRGNDGIETLGGIIDRAIEKNSHNQGLINAFRPVVLERNRLLEEMTLGKIDFSNFDNIRFHGGIPLIRQQAFFPNDTWTEMIAQSRIFKKVDDLFL